MGFVTKMDEKGRVVVSQEIRDQLGLESGTMLLVSVDGDAVILRKAEIRDATENSGSDELDKSSELKKFLTG